MRSSLLNFLLLLFAVCFGIQGKAQSAAAGSQSGGFYPAFTLENPLNDGHLGTLIGSGIIQNRTRLANKPDANASLYVGLGAPEKLVGGGITVNVYGLANHAGEEGNLGQGSLGLHLNRFLLDKKLLIDLGVDNLLGWGGNPMYRKYITYQRSWYLSANYLLSFNKVDYTNPLSYLSITGGIGNGYFRRDAAYSWEKNSQFHPFLSLATPVLRRTNLIAEWSGYELGIGVATIPVSRFPVMVGLGATDLLLGKPRFTGSLSLPLRLKGARAGAERPVGVRTARVARTV